MNAPSRLRSGSALALALSGAALLVAGCGSSGSGSAQPTVPSSVPASAGGSSPAVAGGSSAAASSGSSSTSTPETGSASASASGAATTGSVGTSTAAGSRCRVADLSARLVAGSPGAGQRYATIVLTNTSSATCTIHGYGGGELVAASGKPVPSRFVRETGAVATLRLKPGAKASSQLHWTAIASGSEPQTGNCETPASRLLVTPPDERATLSVAWTGGAVCDQGRIEQQPYVAGTAAR
jgi:hypothetical protein